MDKIQQICFNSGAPMAAITSTVPPPPPPAQKKRRRQEITDDDDVDVIALSVEEMTAEHLFFCELCGKDDFLREQNLLLHRRSHNLSYVLNRAPVIIRDDQKRKVYVCPETNCPHHHRPNALCNLASLKKHFKRKHGEKTMGCTKCFRMYAVEGDLRAHLKVCGSKDSLSSNTTISAPSFPFLSDTIVATPVSNISSTNRSLHLNMTTTDPGINNISIQDSELNDNIFDVNVLHDRFFCISGVPATAFPQPQQGLTLADWGTSALSQPQQGLTLADWGTSAFSEPQQGLTLADWGTSVSFLGSLNNSGATNFNQNIFNGYPNFSSTPSGNSHFPVLEGLSGTYMNAGPSRYHGDNVSGNVLNLQGDYESSIINENIFGTSLGDKATQNGGLWGFGSCQEQLSGHKVGGDANFPVLQDDFNFWENRGN